MQIFALTARGLENAGESEIAAIAGFRVEKTAYRRIEGSYSGNLSALLVLRTVDDFFIALATWRNVSHQRQWLATCADLSARLRPAQYLDALAQLRPIPDPPAFSITANFVGKRNYTAPEIKVIVAENLAKQHPRWVYADDDREADLNIRVFIDHDIALVGLRIAAEPLHRRAYKHFHLPGALKPTVAAAMNRLAGVEPNATLVDPFCGSGTIVIEAALMGAKGLGGDIELDSVLGALVNAQAATVAPMICRWDARSLPIRDGSVDCIVSNMPWGRQVQVDAQLSQLYATSFAEMKRIVAPGGKIVLLTTFPDLLPEQPERAIEISLFGQTPSIVVFAGAH